MSDFPKAVKIMAEKVPVAPKLSTTSNTSSLDSSHISVGAVVGQKAMPGGRKKKAVLVNCHDYVLYLTGTLALASAQVQHVRARVSPKPSAPNRTGPIAARHEQFARGGPAQNSEASGRFQGWLPSRLPPRRPPQASCKDGPSALCLVGNIRTGFSEEP